MPLWPHSHTINLYPIFLGWFVLQQKFIVLLWARQVLRSIKIKMVQALVRKSTLLYHYVCTFTSQLALFLSKYVAFYEQWHPLGYDPFQSNLWCHCKNIIEKYPWLLPITAFLPLDLHWAKETHAVIPNIFYLPLTKIRSKNLWLWYIIIRITVLSPFNHSFLVWSIIQNFTMACTLWPA